MKDSIYKSLSIFSVFGYRYNINIDRSDLKIFYTGENVHTDILPFKKYSDLLLDNKAINLSIGFDYIESEKYIRFPLWLMYLFEPTADFESIKVICEKINNQGNYQDRKRFCSFLARQDRTGTREKLFQEINQIGKIDCDGLFRHNNDDLGTLYNDNKREYLTNYKFNLCPENSNYPGYCTEKIFEAILSGCIPIYWGADNNPEPDILNHKTIFFITPDEDNSDTLNKIFKIYQDEKQYREFTLQDRLLPGAPGVILNYFENLEAKLKKIM